MPVEPWAMYPPEVNAGRMTAGAGTFTWEAAATGWDQVAAAVDEQLVVLGLQSAAVVASWEGLSGVGTAASMLPYAAWLHQAGQSARKNAAAARWVVQSFTTSQATMVPVPHITANRVAVQAARAQAAASAASAVVFPGAAASHAQAMATIAEKEAQYSMFWQQNSTVMAKYDAEITTATTPVPLPNPPSIVRGDSYGGRGAYDPSSAGFTQDYVNGLDWQSPDYAGYVPGQTDTTGMTYIPSVGSGSIPDYSFTASPDSNYTSMGGFTPVGGFNPMGASSGAGSGAPGSFTPSRIPVGGASTTLGTSNALGRAGSLIGRGGMAPSYGAMASPSAMRTTGGLGIGAARAAPAFGGVSNSPTAVRAPMSTGMGMVPAGAGGAAGRRGNNSGQGSSVEGDVRDQDADLFAGIDAFNLSSSVEEGDVDDGGDGEAGTYDPKL